MMNILKYNTKRSKVYKLFYAVLPLLLLVSCNKEIENKAHFASTDDIKDDYSEKAIKLPIS
ncbi:hypothetical protein KUH03_03375 [Sphingobacterium sp. E70]|uniref:hypothetical protein n=1 Tax=Sphingobacterium sp. E70 TaxID=2853439 RepID=UPI00211BF063|nr:hypothetical protein [Sphingobacterium sp. E70]ULT26026.1 hypothetical protein KUH03_03375 [Sphingobacterium sp. E70]